LRLLENWSEDERAALHKAIFVARHRLAELDLFSDERLIDILSRHPARDLGINTMGTDPARRDQWREGVAEGLSPEKLFECVAKGKLWLNLRRVMDHHREYRDLVNDLYDEM